jgi:5-(carboxyamino)imidazole ribonucleotide synthase
MLKSNSRIGILGGGQLGRMLGIAALRLGYKVHIFDPDLNAPAKEIADVFIHAQYDDFDALSKFASAVDVATLEFENIPINAAEIVNDKVSLRPNPKVLNIFQNRLREKNFLASNNISCVPFFAINKREDLLIAYNKINVPCVLKTCELGYDGKGQWKITNQDSIKDLPENIFNQELVLESFIDLKLEVSVMAAQNAEGKFQAWDVIENKHTNHILDISNVPARISPELSQQALHIAQKIFSGCGVIGVMGVEFFIDTSNRLYVNEIAPRVHNSGHLTIEAAYTSQFEQHIRVICDLPFGETRYLAPAAMANILGEKWEKGEPKWHKALQDHDIKLHLYGKQQARPGRKMGHLTCLAQSTESAIKKVVAARGSLTEGK